MESENKILFFLKSMKCKYVDDILKYGRFCFNHPAIFNKWESKKDAQYDPWDAHSVYEATHLIFAPIIDEKDGIPVYGEVHKLADKGIVRTQSAVANKSSICCFRMVEEHEVSFDENHIFYTLGETADKIINEFGHDSYILIQAAPFLERIRQKYSCYCGAVVYRNTLNDYEFQVPEQEKDFVEQLFRKDVKYEWQKEYRIVLPPSDNNPVFIELGSIEDIAICGKISDLRA